VSLALSIGSNRLVSGFQRTCARRITVSVTVIQLRAKRTMRVGEIAAGSSLQPFNPRSRRSRPMMRSCHLAIGPMTKSFLIGNTRNSINRVKLALPDAARAVSTRLPCQG
jgi:hypothetical protein